MFAPAPLKIDLPSHEIDKRRPIAQFVEETDGKAHPL
jgi:hypothetical protein